MRLAAPLTIIAPLIVVAAACAATARADVIPDGYKPVTHEISFDGLAKHADCTFVLFPTDMSGTARTVTDGETVSFYHMVSPYLYAVRGEMPSATAVSSSLRPPK